VPHFRHRSTPPNTPFHTTLLGLVSNFADIHRFMQFAGEFVDLTEVPDDLPPRIAC
jgi:hypothetical protein